MFDARDYEYNRLTKVPRSKNLDDKFAEERQQNFTTDIRYVVCDTLLNETKKRREDYVEVETRFGFLFKGNRFKDEIMSKIKTLILIYEN